MKRETLPHVMLLVCWGVVVLATIPHLQEGPLRPFPLAILCLILSAVVLVIRLLPKGEEAVATSHKSVAVGLLAALLICIVSGTQTVFSVVVGLLAIGLIARHLEAAVALVVLTTVTVAFHGGVVGYGTPAPPSPPWTSWAGRDSAHQFNPNAMLDPTDSSQWKAAVIYGESLFAHVRLEPYDVQRLTSPQGPGPVAHIWPEPNAHLNDLNNIAPPSLGRGRVGRIVAKIRLDSAPAAGYPPLGLFPGVNYIWVDGVEPPHDTSGRAIVIAGDGSGARVRPMVFDMGKQWSLSTTPDWANYSRARWTYGPQGDGLWISCAVHARCILPAEGATP